MKRKLAFGVNSVITVLLVIGIVCTLYYIADRHPLRKDFTKNKIQTLSPITLKTLKGLDKKVEAIAFFETGTPAETMVGDLLKEYGRRSGFFSYSKVDPQQKPAEFKRYAMSDFGVLFISGERRKKVGMQEIFAVSYNNQYGQELPPEFIGEQAFTNAIIAVAADKQKTICFTEGHGERNINGQGEADYSGVRVMLEGENYMTRTVNIATEKTVPSDCNVVVTAGPEKYLSKEEYDTLHGYLAGGGRALFMLDPMKNSSVETMLSEWGIRVGNDIVIDRGRYFGEDALTPVPEFAYHDITSELSRTKLTVGLPAARSITAAQNKPAGVMISPLLETSADSWAETDMTTPNATYDKDKDIKGPVSLAVAVEKPVSGDGGTETRIVVVGDSDFASNGFTVMTPDVVKAIAGGAGNADLFVNMVNWLAGEEKLISIRPKPAEMNPLNITGPQRIRVFQLFVFVIPSLIIMFGGYIWYRRRSL